MPAPAMRTMPEERPAVPPKAYVLECHGIEAAHALAEWFGALDPYHRVEAEGHHVRITYLREPWLLRVAHIAHSRNLISSHAYQQVEEEVLW